MGLKDEGPALVGLQLEQQANGPHHTLATLQALVGVGAVAGDPLEPLTVELGGWPEQALARAADSQRLTASHDLHPRRKARRLGWWGLGEQNLDRALICILGVVGAQRVAASRSPQGCLGAGELRELIGVTAGQGLGDIDSHVPVNPAPAGRAPGGARRSPPCRRAERLGPARAARRPPASASRGGAILSRQ
jgi:hypothetical protein